MAGRDTESNPLPGEAGPADAGKVDLTPEALRQVAALVNAQRHDAFVEKIDVLKKRVIAGVLLATIILSGMQVVVVEASALIKRYNDEFASKITVVQAATETTGVAAPSPCPCHNRINPVSKNPQ
jgi:hypothetical protein